MSNPIKRCTQWVSLLAILLCSTDAWAGNKDRIGESGAAELLINPWVQSAGMGSADAAFVSGIEAMYTNVAGLAHVNQTDIGFVRTDWLSGSDIAINTLGFGQRVSDQSVFGLSLMLMDFGDIAITTEESPEGGLGTFSPQLANIGASYAQEFSNSIYGGATIKVISESVSNAKARGVAFDVGIRYETGDLEELKFGIALKNVGPKLAFQGDAFSTGIVLNDEDLTLQQRTATYELPAQLNMGASYDFYLGPKGAAQEEGEGEKKKKKKKAKTDHRLTGAATFNSNSFGKDRINAGAEYSFKEQFTFRVGYIYEEGVTSSADRTSALTGPAAGATVALPINKKGTQLSLSYAYRATNPFDGSHGIGLRLLLANSEE